MAKRKQIKEGKRITKTCEENCGRCLSQQNFEHLEISLKSDYNSIYETLSQGAIVQNRATCYEKEKRVTSNVKSSLRKVFNKG